MSTAAVLNFNRELAEAEAIAVERRKAWEEAPEISAKELLDALKLESGLQEARVDFWGKVYFYPMTIADHLAMQDKLGDDGRLGAPALVEALIERVRNADGSQKFTAADADTLIRAKRERIMLLFAAVFPSHKISMAAAEKK